jgi:hypothetical protein
MEHYPNPELDPDFRLNLWPKCPFCVAKVHQLTGDAYAVPCPEIYVHRLSEGSLNQVCICRNGSVRTRSAWLEICALKFGFRRASKLPLLLISSLQEYIVIVWWAEHTWVYRRGQHEKAMGNHVQHLKPFVTVLASGSSYSCCGPSHQNQLFVLRC